MSDLPIPRAAEHARKIAEGLSGYGHAIPRPVTEEWLVAAAERGMVRRADLVDGAWYVGCCRNAYMARWFAKAKHDPRARWSLRNDEEGKEGEGEEWWRSEVMPRRVAEAEAEGARVTIEQGGTYAPYTVILHDGGCTDEGCTGLDAHDGCFPREPAKGAFIHMRTKFSSVFTEVINHPEDDDGWDLFVPTMMVLGPMA